MAQTIYVMFDGLQDPLAARELSRRWAEEGIVNELDPAGQWAALRPAPPREDSLGEQEVVLARRIARRFGLEIRDRLGLAFNPLGSAEPLRRQLETEYRAHLAKAFMFCLPALVLHYLAPLLAGGRAQEATGLAIPWFIEMILVGWACYAAGGPILWQGALSLRYRRCSGDLLTSLILLLAWLPSAQGVVSLAWRRQSWLGLSGAASGPAFHAAALALLLALAQRWLLHRYSARLAGRADRLIPGLGWVIGSFLAVMFLALLLGQWRLALALGLVLPPMISLGAIHPLTPGLRMLLPVFSFAVLLWLGPAALSHGAMGQGIPRVEIAAGFQFILLLLFYAGWRSWPAAKSE